jgi:rRNA maturation endonuclease Nob1
MTVVIGILMVIAAIAYVAAPLFTGIPGREFNGSQPVTASKRERWERQKFEAYAAIKEVEFDHQMGKLSEADFAAIRDKYAAQALEAIAALDAARAVPSRQAVEGRRARRIAYCPGCGVSVPARAKFCPACGRSLQEEAVA